VKGWRKE
jgi:hypothetical protein